MNIDDPKLTAFALGELEEPERSTMARAVAESPGAQRFVEETRELAEALKKEFASELKTETSEPANLIDIRDDPWFWSIGRPLAIAAVLALLAIVSGVAVFSSRHERVRVAQADALRLPPVPQQPAEVEGELQIPTEAAPPPATTTAS